MLSSQRKLPASWKSPMTRQWNESPQSWERSPLDLPDRKIKAGFQQKNSPIPIIITSLTITREKSYLIQLYVEVIILSHLTQYRTQEKYTEIETTSTTVVTKGRHTLPSLYVIVYIREHNIRHYVTLIFACMKDFSWGRQRKTEKKMRFF